MIVMKFGGTSLESASAIERVASIVKSQLARKPVVVVSAMGRTTQKLLDLGARAAEGQKDEALQRLSGLREFHLRELRPVVAAPDHSEMECIINDHFRELTELITGLAVGELPPRSVDAISSYGERLSSRLIALAFRNFGISSAHLDARSSIITDERHTQASPLYRETYARLRAAIPPLARDKVVVLGGFIGSTENGETTTLGRGGSDFTASIVGAGIAAEEIQIWTDVDGMMTSDPRLVPNAHRVKIISFAEAAELAYFGAKVLHPATVLPAVEKNIPVLILNSRRPEVPGTRIVAATVRCTNVIKSITCKRNITVVNIRSARMLMAHGFLRRIFEIFDRCETPVDMLATSEVSVSLTIDNSSRLEEIGKELRQFSEVTVEKNQAIVCLVGDNLQYTPGVAARVFGALPGVNVRMISQGASLLNLGLVVASEDAQKAVSLLHEEFFRTLDPAVFD